jgi:hypothetical protein
LSNPAKEKDLNIMSCPDNNVTSAERRLHASIAAHSSWANTPDRAARTAKARAALDQRFLDEADGDPRRAAHLRKVYFQRLALRSAQSRRKAREATQAAEAAEAELAEAGEGR